MTEVNLSAKYQQKTDKQHILDNPDTYIGSVENVDANMWVLNETGDKIVEKNIKYIPGLFKLFDRRYSKLPRSCNSYATSYCKQTRQLCSCFKY